jgi:predicted protein tyrosine phosphatase
VKKLLFVCSANKLRSPTAEHVFSRRQDIEVASAGTNSDADIPITAELIAWADLIAVMEKVHRTKLQKRFRSELKDKRLICLDIPDNYAFMDIELIQLLKEKMSRHLP